MIRCGRFSGLAQAGVAEGRSVWWFAMSGFQGWSESGLLRVVLFGGCCELFSGFGGLVGVRHIITL